MVLKSDYVRGSTFSHTDANELASTVNDAVVVLGQKASASAVAAGLAGKADVSALGGFLSKEEADTNYAPVSLADDVAARPTAQQVTNAVSPKLDDPRKLWVSCARRARMANLGGLTNGTDTGAMTRFGETAPADIGEIELTYVGKYSSASVETATPNPLTVRAAIEYPAGVFTPVYTAFGSRDVTLDPGATAKLSGYVPIPKGAQYWVRTFVTVTAGGKWPFGVYQGVSANGDGVEQGTSVTDKTTSGTVTASNNYAYGPSAIRTRRRSRAQVDVLGIGDSNAFGQGDSQDRGMIYRALGDNYAYRNLGFSGSQVTDFTESTLAISLPKWRTRMQLAEGATHAIVIYGTNDLSGAKTAEQIKTALVDLYNRLTAMGIEVWGTTIVPRSTSTDAWATTANQTTATTNAIRVEVNDWIRTKPAPLAGCFDIADALETARNSGIWKAGQTGDGVHCNSNGAATGATAINPSLLVVA